jgi:hypothetical protein
MPCMCQGRKVSAFGARSAKGFDTPQLVHTALKQQAIPPAQAHAKHTQLHSKHIPHWTR